MNKEEIKYEVTLNVPQHLVGETLKDLQNLLQVLMNKSSTMKLSELVSVKKLDEEEVNRTKGK